MIEQLREPIQSEIKEQQEIKGNERKKTKELETEDKQEKVIIEEDKAQQLTTEQVEKLTLQKNNESMIDCMIDYVADVWAKIWAFKDFV